MTRFFFRGAGTRTADVCKGSHLMPSRYEYSRRKYRTWIQKRNEEKTADAFSHTAIGFILLPRGCALNRSSTRCHIKLQQQRGSLSNHVNVPALVSSRTSLWRDGQVRPRLFLFTFTLYTPTRYSTTSKHFPPLWFTHNRQEKRQTSRACLQKREHFTLTPVAGARYPKP